MKSASHTSTITALKFTCCSSLSVSCQQNCFTLRTVHNHLWTRVPTHLCNRILIKIYREYFLMNIFVGHTFPMSKSSIKTKTVLTMTDMTEST